ncbi:hypothetical protein [Pseudoxanthomonas suwonensis]
MSARMPDGFGSRPSGDCPCYRSADVVPPLRAPLAIRARGEDGYSTWFAGTFDGRCWWSPELPADEGQWAVVGWRAIEDYVPERMPPCQRSRRNGPRLFRGNGGTPVPSHGMGVQAQRETTAPGPA